MGRYGLMRFIITSRMLALSYTDFPLLIKTLCNLSMTGGGEAGEKNKKKKKVLERKKGVGRNL